VTIPLQTLVLETAAVCNLRCTHCACGLGLTPKRAQPYLDLALAQRVLAQVGHVVTCYPALWGEPTLHPQLIEVLGAIRPHATSVVLTTNGVAVDARLANGIARRVDRTLVGIPAATATTYTAICGVDRFEAALSGLQRLALEAPAATTWVYVVTRENEGEADAARQLAARLGVDFTLKPVYAPAEFQGRPATAAHLSRYDAAGAPRADLLACRDFWAALQVLADGRVTTCCYDYHNEIVIGDATTQHVLDDLWNGPAYQELRANHLAGDLAAFCQRNCGRVP
jgi:MoaA/NifB/PqqE/SkfB family radical SAM enzyme